MSAADCIFCGIVAGKAPAEVVAQDDRALAFMDINPATDGHTLVVPRTHAEYIWDLEPQDGRAVWTLAQEVAAAIRAGLEPDGLTLFQANRKVGWQDVFHFHLHLVPRWVTTASSGRGARRGPGVRGSRLRRPRSGRRPGRAFDPVLTSTHRVKAGTSGGAAGGTMARFGDRSAFLLSDSEPRSLCLLDLGDCFLGSATEG